MSAEVPSSADAPPGAPSVVFLHPDLGIGGAERAMIDMALALKARGYRVVFVTGHHDPTRCFEETRDGQLEVVVSAGWLPRSLLGRCIALCAFVRMLLAALFLVVRWRGPDMPRAVIVDQVSAPIPLLNWFGHRTVFYCHYPDLLLSTDRASRLKRLYRRPLDALEAWTTGQAAELMVNSRYTAGVVRTTFPELASRQLRVVYPVPNFASLDAALDEPSGREELRALWPSDSLLFVSLNRYERKKNVALALRAFARVLESLRQLENGASRGIWRRLHLVIAGGYDERVRENVEHFAELTELAERLGLSSSSSDCRVTFLRSCSSPAKAALIASATALVYTPANEHFGIVPVEAQYLGCPVIAADSGGPLETVLHGATGFLCPPTEAEFAAAIQRLATEPELRAAMGRAGRRHAAAKFANAALAQAVAGIVEPLTQTTRAQQQAATGAVAGAGDQQSGEESEEEEDEEERQLSRGEL